MPNAARVGDMLLHDAPHCHAPIHPPAPTPTPLPHPPRPLTVTGPGVPTVMIGGMPAAVVGDMGEPCLMVSCVPGAPGVIAMGSTTVFIGGKPAARVGDLINHSSCIAPIPSPTGKILPPGAPTVIIGG